MDELPRLFKTRSAWRAWLARNHDKEKGIWLAYYKKGSGKRSVTYEEALQEALCYGWIDSTVGRLDAERYKQRYTPRNLKSVWSPSNKARVEKLIADGLMAPPGLAKVEAAKRTGSWDILNDVERIGRGAEIPADLLEALAKDGRARQVFEKRPPSEKKLWGYWILSAKKPETRARRIEETVKRLIAGRRPGF
ncbi:MAG: YdeI/OmpD-associated family protein [Candidatus Aminicenantes bacterium]|nr:YdeI/OmpD-associated family protein [Candidatus Aminicenantes bacterium]MCJ7485474.1 YdeI/OmpD-associated family protein [Candidatus Aminicenantes bacterium]